MSDAKNTKATIDLMLAQIKSSIFDAPADDRKKFEDARDEMSALIEKYGDHGKVAATLIGLTVIRDNSQ